MANEGANEETEKIILRQYIIRPKGFVSSQLHQYFVFKFIGLHKMILTQIY